MNTELIERLERILPGLQNSSSSAEDAMIRALPEVIAALKSAGIVGKVAGIYAAAKLIDRKVDDYVKEHGSYDPSTGQTEFSSAGEEYLETLEELAEEIRTLALKGT
jgi:hypothetical protein